ncbi:hypothetical protein ASAC_0032 [Acidilobus saccharovorans 345-15]|uniref:Uncharacterized protein n=1 Tax=Acidilobus saccharovorans (strain DSM 16705 / JCM 18335 / VKM B-2471 / 345-15) TaxID=666510 RepID=D9PZF2_ACIS3|nr:hypothetical protein [Acidilobus saccharovorans]ADL18440.1 hypothetical protein ASAC_0032 [Acidilobus saccharovorans 345-15]
MARKLIVFDCRDVRVVDPSQLSQLDREGPGDLFIVLIDGDVIASGRLTVVRNIVEGQQEAQQAPAAQQAQRGERGGVAAVLDQMFRGYYPDVIEREEPDVELHVIVGRGLQAPQQAGPRRVLEPANDDFDVLKVVERVARGARRVLFFTGDKRLAGQAEVTASQLGNVEVHYMPPNEFPGKESLAKAMIEAIEKAKASLPST